MLLGRSGYALDAFRTLRMYSGYWEDGRRGTGCIRDASGTVRIRSGRVYDASDAFWMPRRQPEVDGMLLGWSGYPLDTLDAFWMMLRGYWIGWTQR